MKVLKATNLPAGAQVTLTCKAKKKRACPFSTKKRSYKTGKKSDNLLPLLKRRALPVGTILTVKLSAPATLSKIFRFTVKRTGLVRTLTCATPSGAKASCLTS